MSDQRNMSKSHFFPSHISSAICWMTYEPLAKELRHTIKLDCLTYAHGFLTIKFRSGGRYAYLIPQRVYASMCRSRSKGRAFHRLIKGKFPSVNLDKEIVK